MDFGVRDKAYAIVGGVAGMGLDTARLLAAEGAKVALIGRNRERGELRARAMAEEFGADVRMIMADGTVKGAMDLAMAEAVSHFGRLDGVCVTAGTMQTRKSLLELEDEVWEEYFQVHVMVTVRACRAALPHLIAAGGGSIVKNIALTYGSHNVRANTVCPGFIASESAQGVIRMAAEKYGLPPLEAIAKAMVEDWPMNVAMGRVGLSTEIADLFAFLLSARAGYLTGATINCDGGTQF